MSETDLDEIKFCRKFVHRTIELEPVSGSRLRSTRPRCSGRFSEVFVLAWSNELHPDSTTYFHLSCNEVVFVPFLHLMVIIYLLLHEDS